MKWLKISATIVVLVLIAAWAAWSLVPIQILVLADRLRNPIAATRPVRWEQGPATPPAGDRPPNIILIVADDLGLTTSASTAMAAGRGRDGQTPNIDALARQGRNFTTAYAANATCSPSRAAMMTGRYPTRFGFELPRFRSPLAEICRTPKGRGRTRRSSTRSVITPDVRRLEDMGVPAKAK